MSPLKNGSNEATANRRALSLTSMYFNRFLVFRYVTAIFFFVNLYWAIVLLGDCFIRLWFRHWPIAKHFVNWNSCSDGRANW